MSINELTNKLEDLIKQLKANYLTLPDKFEKSASEFLNGYDYGIKVGYNKALYELIIELQNIIRRDSKC